MIELHDIDGSLFIAHNAIIAIIGTGPGSMVSLINGDSYECNEDEHTVVKLIKEAQGAQV